MSKKTISPFPLRLEPELRQILEEAANMNNRSLQVEIVARLMESAGQMPDEEKRLRQIVQEELRKAGIVEEAPEREPGFSIPMQKKTG